MQLVRPKVLVLEIAFHIPPPFRFAAQHDPARFSEWLRDYDVTAYNPTAGCSLSYALHGLRPYGMHLLSLSDHDAILVHESVAPLFERTLGVLFPQDEFTCFRKSRLWMQFPVSYVREWFFAAHPGESLGRVWSNITRVQREVHRTDAPFSLDY
eukprot:gnl/TRDRNA2_/TRDRNA2_155981_c0_seq2.p1 gnl/TRDRNA2_/TRDRNA2_155981_c0~~gnl/TRDRNA2_/TRDRNA2_155981_c0_seq2.p1  ORF type:complete len:154 (+),score=3.39 gnl/TRDRNA2_/TRDRNA2_155981_c0_seq2:33-494(+)